MAPPAGTLRVGRYFGALVALLAVLYAIVFWPNQPKTPKLGLDLEGGAQVILKGLSERAAAARGNVVLPRCPPAWKRALPVWGTPRGDAWLMRKVKDAFDPRRLFNPGRFVE